MTRPGLGLEVEEMVTQSASGEGEDGLVIAGDGDGGNGSAQLPPDLCVSLTPSQLDLIVGVEVLLIHTVALPGDVGAEYDEVQLQP